jgi:tannase
MIHYHDEAGASLPKPSSVYHSETTVTFNASGEALGELYRFFLIHGAAHCACNEPQPDGPSPESDMNTVTLLSNGTFMRHLMLLFRRALRQ